MNTHFTQAQAERFAARIVRIAVICAAVLAISGGIFYFFHFGGTIPHYEKFTGEPAHLTTIHGVIGAAMHFNFRAVMQFGVIILLLIPLCRVAVFLGTFIMQRDWLYSIITFIVLSILLYALL
jgi:uncharacterized membrane protein